MFTMPSPLAAKWKPSDNRMLSRHGMKFLLGLLQCRVYIEICLYCHSLREHGEDVSNSLHGHCWSVAVLHSPHPPLMQEVPGQNSQGGGGSSIGCHAERESAVGGLHEVLHV